MAKASKALEVSEDDARNLLEQLEFSNAASASVKKLTSILAGLPKRLEDEEEEPDVDKKGQKLLDKLADAVDKKMTITVLEAESDEEEEEEEAPKKKGKTAKAAKGSKAKADKETGNGEVSKKTEEFHRMMKTMSKGPITAEDLATKAKVSERRAEGHLSWMESKDRAKKLKGGRYELVEAE